MRKNDHWLKNHHSNTGSTASDDSTGSDHYCMRSDTTIINSYIYQWAEWILFNYRNSNNIYFLSCTWSMRRNDYRHMDSNGCMRQSACTCNKNDHCIACTCACIYRSTSGCNGGMWSCACGTNSGLQQLCKWDVSDIRNCDGYKEWNSNRMRRHTYR